MNLEDIKKVGIVGAGTMGAGCRRNLRPIWLHRHSVQ